MKKIKIFGIGAAALLIIIAIGPCITSADPSGLSPYTDLAAQYNTQFNDLQAYMDTWYREHGTMEGIVFTPELQQFLDRYAVEVQGIYDQYGIPQQLDQPQRFWGINGIWHSKNQITPPGGSGVYWCHQIAINHNLTKFFGDLIWNMGFIKAYITFGIIMVIILGITNPMWWYIMGVVWDHWTDFRDFFQWYHGQSGAIFYHWHGAPWPYTFKLLYQPDLSNNVIYRWVHVGNTWHPNYNYWEWGF